MNIASLLSDENWIRAFGVTEGSLAQQTIRKHLLEAHAEIERLQEAKRRFSALADAKGKENVELRQQNERLRAALKQIADDPQRDGLSRNIAGAALIGYRAAEQEGDSP